ncbi:MAG: transcription-repair coupling factor [Selenomonadaceae bacterium]|nr:transcription-repair coupling factor [Selenomonadaceae bacterium]
MKTLFEGIMKSPSMKKITALSEHQGQTLVYDVSDSAKRVAAAALYNESPRAFLIVSSSYDNVKAWTGALKSLLPEVGVYELPELASFDVEGANKSMEREERRMDILGRLALGEPIIVLSTVYAAAQKSMTRRDFEAASLTVEVGDVMPRVDFLKKLSSLGYERTTEVERTGEFSSRGGIVDIFPINATTPYRIEFFDDEVDTIRSFDIFTKRSTGNRNRFSILPLAASLETKGAGITSFLNADSTVIFEDPLRLQSELKNIAKENKEIKKKLLDWDGIMEECGKKSVFFFTMLLQQVHGATLTETLRFSAPSMTAFRSQTDFLANELTRYIGEKKEVLLLLSTDEKAAALRETLAKRRIPSAVIKDGEPLSQKRVSLMAGHLSGGFSANDSSLVVITELDIFGREQKRAVKRSENEAKISHFTEIKVGDYVVHDTHGIGKYLGVETIEIGGIHKDYLHIKYAGDDKLFVPTDQVNLLSKYIGGEGAPPKLHKMSSAEWKKAKSKAKAAVEDIADELIEIYSKRKLAKGYAFSKDDNLQQEFEDAFPYEETEDQLRAAEEIKRDMEKEKPMERLLCGDVGFGKTEVAMRAAFKAAMDGKQVAVLAPTTVLAQQHYQTFSARFMDFPPKVDVVCRFRTAKEQKATLEKVAAGEVDILIGTHAILNQRKVQFMNLGLLIVDEEQRFGVKQKEKIKRIAEGVDVLTLSATPIPRTLHMSLVGARDMSVIETAPPDRFPVQTYVAEDSDSLLSSAIRRELKRGGQIYFVYNRVETIDRMRDRLQKIAPEARIMTAHGQMPEEMLESVMMDFFEGRYDILLATTIIENGLDVANANTIIIYDADKFGLSQLYQMRGRVGRSHHLAFAYFLYRRDKVLSETAEKRLQTMKEFAELGAGFKIAMRDLEIRGAGNLLGSAQHGHIESVGFQMYSKMLEEAVEERRGNMKKEEEPEPIVDIAADAYIEGEYIESAMHKLEIYRRIAAIRKNEEIPSIIDELVDRFGEPTKPVMNLLSVARIKNYARNIGVTTIKEQKDKLTLVLKPNPNLSPKGVQMVESTFKNSVRMIPNMNRMEFRLMPRYKQNIVGFVTRLMMMLAGDTEAFMKKRGA